MLKIAICDDDLLVAGRIEELICKIAKGKINKIDIDVFSFTEYALDVFEVKAHRYLVKPIGEAELVDSFSSALQELGAYEEVYWYKFRNVHHCLRLKDVLYFESEKRIIKIKESGNSHKIALNKNEINGADEQKIMYGRLGEVEKKIGDSKLLFLRIHQSYLVNYLHIAELAYDYVVMDNGEKLPISEERRKKIRSTFFERESI
jgi:Response regulator of the LytR/AlgR family